LKKYINSEGNIIKNATDVDIYDNYNKRIGGEYFSSYPNLEQVYYSICKYGGFKAELRTVYEINYVL